MNHHRRPVAALTAWLVGLAAALAALLTIGAELPGVPPLTRPAGWSAWASDRETLDLVAAGARLLAVAALAYLLVVTLAQLVAGLLGERSPRKGRWLVRVTPRFVGALTAAAIASTGTVGADEAADGVPSSRDDQHLPAAAGSVAVRPGMGATMQLITPGEETSLPWADDVHPAPGDDAPAESADEPPSPPPPTTHHLGEWVVRPGDHLWRIAEELLLERGNAEPNDAEVRDLWVRLIDTNRDRFVDPENPDLILPGQRLTLPRDTRG